MHATPDRAPGLAQDRVQERVREHPGDVVRAVVGTAAAGFVGYLILAALTVGMGLLLTRELVHGVVGRWDVDVARWFVQHRTPGRNDLSAAGSTVSATLTVVAVVVVAGVCLAIGRHWRELGIVLVAMAVEGATYLTATWVISRHRPRVARLEHLIVSDSFFSGHVAAAVALYGSLAVVVWSLTRQPVIRALLVALALVAPVVVASSRMYRGMHYLSDVSVGALVGLGCIVVAIVAVRVGATVGATKVEQR